MSLLPTAEPLTDAERQVREHHTRLMIERAKAAVAERSLAASLAKLNAAHERATKP